MLLRLTIPALILLLSPSFARAAEPARPEPSPLPGFSAIGAGPGLTLYRDMYVLPATLSDRYDGSRTEVVFRVSAKLRITGSRFFLGFTQLSFWQAYNDAESSPFRETNYNPEVFYRLVPSNSKLERWGADFGFSHESNGQSGEDSRSWNRIYATVYGITPRFLVSAKLWHRLKEDRCPIDEDGMELEECAVDSSFDDNPRIADFMGYGELSVRHQWNGGGHLQQLHLMVRGNLATGKGAVSLDYTHPAGSKDLHWFAKAQHGYGESLIDHDRSVSRLGVGILLRR